MSELRESVVVLTGASSGIGLATARALEGRAGTLIAHGLEPIDGELTYVPGDFLQLASVAETAERVARLTDRVDVLVNNAGIPGPPQRSITADGHEATLQVNLLAGALLADRLRGLIPAGGRVVNVASATHYSASLDLNDLELERGAYSPVRAYARSKLAVVTYSAWLAGELPEIDVVSVHPGVISSGLLHAMFGAGGAPVDEAASVLVDMATRQLESGAYYDEHEPATPNPEALERGNQERLARFVQAAIA